MVTSVKPAMHMHPELLVPALIPPGTGPVAGGWRTNKRVWIEACALRLSTLAPELGPARCGAVAANLWEDVGGYDPVIAAEMEYEAGVFDH